jgi:carbon storage regulator CsrA
MLVLTRRVGEELVIDGDIHVVVLAVKGDKVRLGLDQAKPAHLGEARNGKNSKSLVFLGRLML